MNLHDTMMLGYGTSEGAKRGWDKRGRKDEQKTTDRNREIARFNPDQTSIFGPEHVKELQRSRSNELYHATRIENVQSILNDGLKPGSYGKPVEEGGLVSATDERTIAHQYGENNKEYALVVLRKRESGLKSEAQLGVNDPRDGWFHSSKAVSPDKIVRIELWRRGEKAPYRVLRRKDNANHS